MHSRSCDARQRFIDAAPRARMEYRGLAPIHAVNLHDGFSLGGYCRECTLLRNIPNHVRGLDSAESVPVFEPFECRRGMTACQAFRDAIAQHVNFTRQNVRYALEVRAPLRNRRTTRIWLGDNAPALDGFDAQRLAAQHEDVADLHFVEKAFLDSSKRRAAFEPHGYLRLIRNRSDVFKKRRAYFA